jgi:hypothetical protein
MGADIFFRENKGQVHDQLGWLRSDILFSGVINGLEFHLKNDGLQYQQRNASGDIYRVDVKWVNAKPSAEVKCGRQLPGEENFYNQPKGGLPITRVKQYESVTYHNLYPGIDLVWYIRGGNLEYDFIIHPGADPGIIQMEIKGADISVSNQQELLLTTPFGQIKEGSLQVFQNSKTVAARWKQSGNRVGFQLLENYDRNQILRIDPPVRQWGTYYGGTRRDEFHAVAAYGQDAVYAAGFTQSDGAGVIATVGAHQTIRGSTSTGNSGRDALLVKFNAAGVRQWATYYGGNQEDRAWSCATDGDGNVYIAGNTLSGSGIATAGAHNTSTFTGDGFLVKFNSNGQRQWGTYYGGDFSADGAQFTCTDAQGNVFVIGTSTGNTTEIASAGAHQTAPSNANTEGYIAKFNSAGVRQWGTYYGGDGLDFPMGCATDAEGNLYVSGYTSSTNNITTAGSHQPAFGTGTYDGFLVKFNTSGDRQWGTYYGGTANDYGYACVTDAEGNVYLAGATYSAAGISTAGAHQTVKAGNANDNDAFLTKFNTSGARQWGTYYGGSGNDDALACARDHSGNIYLCGGTTSGVAIASDGAYQGTIGGNGLASDGYLAKFGSSGSREWGTYYGAQTDDDARGVAVGAGGVYLAGRTNSVSSVLASNGAHQSAYNGDINSSTDWYDGWLAKFDDGTLLVGSYNFTGSGSWSNAANWQGNNLPPATIPSGTTIIINPAGDSECVLDVPVTLGSGATINVMPGKKFRVNGNLSIQ